MTAICDTAISSSLERAGLNIVAATLRILGHDALAKHHCNVDRALKTFDRATDDDPRFISELKRFFLSALAEERREPSVGHPEGENRALHAGARQSNGGEEGHKTSGIQASRAASSATSRDGASHLNGDAQQPAARPARAPSMGQRAAAATVAKAIAKTVLDICKTNDGRAWGDVIADELTSMGRDGDVAHALKIRIGPLSNAQHRLPIRKLITVEAFKDVWHQSREQVHA